MKNCFLMLSRLKTRIILFLDRLRSGGRTGNLSSRNKCAFVDCYYTACSVNSPPLYNTLPHVACTTQLVLFRVIVDVLLLSEHGNSLSTLAVATMRDCSCRRVRYIAVRKVAVFWSCVHVSALQITYSTLR